MKSCQYLDLVPTCCESSGAGADKAQTTVLRQVTVQVQVRSGWVRLGSAPRKGEPEGTVVLDLFLTKANSGPICRNYILLLFARRSFLLTQYVSP